ncbi:MAG: FecR domain-containing protein [Bacteroidota bacterium]
MENKHRAEIDQLSRHYRTTFQPSVEAGLGRLHAHMAVEQRSASRSFSWMKVAASVALLAVAAFGLRAWINSNNSDFATTDFTKELSLPDGSVILLNHNSDFQLAEDFNLEERRVYLEGEAYFEVAPDKDRPFILVQDDLELKVVGTAFNLETDPLTGSLMVEVSEGLVRLSTDDEQIEVGPQQCGARNDRSTPLRLEPAPHLNRHAWRTGQLSFEATPLKEVLLAIASSYRINWEIEGDMLATCGQLPFTARFDNDPIEDVIATLSQQFNLTISTQATSEQYIISGSCQ